MPTKVSLFKLTKYVSLLCYFSSEMYEKMLEIVSINLTLNKLRNQQFSPSLFTFLEGRTKGIELFHLFQSKIPSYHKCFIEEHS